MRLPSQRLLLTLVIASCCWPVKASAHPGVHHRIDRIGEEIAARPTAARYLKRALLHLEHGNLDAAHHDLHAANKVGGQETKEQVLWLSARIAYEKGDFQHALDRLNQLGALRADAASTHVLLLRSRALTRLGRASEGLHAMEQALNATVQPSVDLYLEAAELYREAGKPEAALEKLDAGLARHSDSLVLARRAFELERERERWAHALERQQALPQRLHRTPRFLWERATIVEAMGRSSEARALAEQALAELQTYPEQRRTAPAFAALHDQIQELLAGMPPPAPIPSSKPRPSRTPAYAVIALPLLTLAFLGGAAYRRRRKGSKS